MSESETFVVAVDPAVIEQRWVLVRRGLRQGAVITAVIGAVGIAAGLWGVFGFEGALWPYGLLLALAMLPLVISTVLALRLEADRRRWFSANEVQPVAMRMSYKGLELACEGARYPVLLPWKAIRGFRQVKVFGQYVLELVLAPGVGATTAGVRGLDQPSVRAIVKPNPLLRSTGLFPVPALDQPVHIIDRALLHYSGGNAGIVR